MRRREFRIANSTVGVAAEDLPGDGENRNADGSLCRSSGSFDGTDR